jgi:hypothetical protein
MQNFKYIDINRINDHISNSGYIVLNVRLLIH